MSPTSKGCTVHPKAVIYHDNVIKHKCKGCICISLFWHLFALGQFDVTAVLSAVATHPFQGQALRICTRFWSNDRPYPKVFPGESTTSFVVLESFSVMVTSGTLSLWGNVHYKYEEINTCCSILFANYQSPNAGSWTAFRMGSGQTWQALASWKEIKTQHRAYNPSSMQVSFHSSVLHWIRRCSQFVANRC